MMHIRPSIPAWRELEAYLSERDGFHGHEIALTDYGLMCITMPGGSGSRELYLVRYEKTSWDAFDWGELPADLRKTLRKLAEPNANDWICPPEDFPNIVCVNVTAGDFESGIREMKQVLRLLDYGWILSEPCYAPCIWGESPWGTDVVSMEFREDFEMCISPGRFLLNRILHDEVLPKEVDWAGLTREELWLNGGWGRVLAKRPELAEYCPFEELTASGWGSLLAVCPEYSHLCNWSLFTESDDGCVSALSGILAAQPQLLPLVDAGRISAADWAVILGAQPHLASSCDFSLFDVNAWMMLLSVRPEFSSACDWSKLSSKDIEVLFSLSKENSDPYDMFSPYISGRELTPETWAMILLRHPEQGEHCSCWKRIRGYDWRFLLLAHPEFADKCPWRKLSGETVFRLLLKHPELARYADMSALKERERCILKYDFPEMFVRQAVPGKKEPPMNTNER